MSEHLRQRNIADFLAHRPPMILIDHIEQHGDNYLLTSVSISEHSPFFDPVLRRVPNYVGIEYMAQSIAALAGVEAERCGEPIRVGFLLGSRKLQLHCAGFWPGKQYQTAVRRLYQEDSGLAVFDCEILHQGETIASANVNVFQPRDTAAYVAGGAEVSVGDPT
ncbi:hotdog family protein [Shewanella yunxiaonensis]|uniref:Hotdog family protein n=1 Tax=Shewanella yunxiaonensis TaxID=2829809 RepID=A0ABX7YU63_9GAMM|nr:hotdog family protein [Shewanella yunxiaonensis]QUN05721.1 hotdog family protein [Shewanella yunxiaonensis]